MIKIDKDKLKSSLEYVRLSNTIYHTNESINKLLDELVELQQKKNDTIINQNNHLPNKEYKFELENTLKETSSFEEVEQILRGNDIEYKLGYREHETNDGQLHWSTYYCNYLDLSFHVNINEWEECIKEGDYYVEPIIEDKYAPPIFKCYGIE
jgi:hypothetical protein